MKCYICKRNEGKLHPIYGYPLCRNCAKKLIFRKIGNNLRRLKIRKKEEIKVFIWESSLSNLALEYLKGVIEKWKPRPKIISVKNDPDVKIVPAEVLLVYLIASFYDKKYFNEFKYFFEKNITWNVTEKEAEFVTGQYLISFENEFLNDIFLKMKEVLDKKPSYYKTYINFLRFTYENNIFFL